MLRRAARSSAFIVLMPSVCAVFLSLASIACFASCIVSRMRLRHLSFMVRFRLLDRSVFFAAFICGIVEIITHIHEKHKLLC